MSSKERLRILDDLVIEEILSLSENEIANKTTDADIALTRVAFEKACTILGKTTLAEAKAALALVAAGAKLTPGLGDGFHTKLLRPSNMNQPTKLTMAARNQKADHAKDQAGIDEDVAELAAWASQDKNV